MTEKTVIAAFITTITLASVATMTLAGRCVELSNELSSCESQLVVSQKHASELTEELKALKLDLTTVELDLAIANRRLEEVDTETVKEKIVETPRHYDIALPAELQTFTYTVCKEYEIPEYYELVLALMQHESQFVDHAVSPTDDYGLMQINKINHSWLSEDLDLHDMLNPYQNIRAGVHMLSTYLKEYEDVAAALMCYNMGEHTAEYYWEQGIRSTSYSDSILAIYREYIDIKIEQ